MNDLIVGELYKICNKKYLNNRFVYCVRHNLDLPVGHSGSLIGINFFYIRNGDLFILLDNKGSIYVERREVHEFKFYDQPYYKILHKNKVLYIASKTPSEDFIRV